MEEHAISSIARVEDSAEWAGEGKAKWVIGREKDVFFRNQSLVALV
jgi:hypothetical protein